MGHYHGSIAWAYFKVEGVPPMTKGFFNGTGGAILENVVGGAARTVIGIIESSIKNMDESEAKAKRDKELALIAAQEAAKAEEMKKKREAALAKIAKEEEAKQKNAEEKAKEAEKKPAEKPANKPKDEKKK